MSQLEVESKIKVDNPVIMRQKISKIASFVARKKREDKYFELAKGYPKKAFRVRLENSAYIVNFKKWLRELWDKEIVVKEEFELALTKPEFDTLMQLFRDLGFKEWVNKDKECEIYRYNKDKKLIIELNKVKKLGYFLEIEYICPRQDLEKARKLIRNVIKELSINKKDIDNTGYTKLLYNKK
jgi:adenylate cyclase class 2